MALRPVMLLPVFFVLAFAAPASASAPKKPRVRLVGKVASGQRLRVERGGEEKDVLTLPPWVSPDEVSVSPTGRHALVFAKLRRGQARTAIVLDVASVTRAHETGRFRPGVGGSFVWTPSEGVLLTAGCGTSCASLHLFDAKGARLAELLCDGFDAEHELSKDRRFVACFSTSPSGNAGEIEIVDTTTGHTAQKAHLPCTSFAGVNRDAVRFETAHERVTFTCTDVVRRTELAVEVRWGRGEPAVTKRPLAPAPAAPPHRDPPQAPRDAKKGAHAPGPSRSLVPSLALRAKPTR